MPKHNPVRGIRPVSDVLDRYYYLHSLSYNMDRYDIKAVTGKEKPRRVSLVSLPCGVGMFLDVVPQQNTPYAPPAVPEHFCKV